MSIWNDSFGIYRERYIHPSRRCPDSQKALTVFLWADSTCAWFQAQAPDTSFLLWRVLWPPSATVRQSRAEASLLMSRQQTVNFWQVASRSRRRSKRLNDLTPSHLFKLQPVSAVFSVGWKRHLVVAVAILTYLIQYRVIKKLTLDRPFLIARLNHNQVWHVSRVGWGEGQGEWQESCHFLTRPTFL